MTAAMSAALTDHTTAALADLIQNLTLQEALTAAEQDRRGEAITVLCARHPFVDDQFWKAVHANVDSSTVAFVAAAAARIAAAESAGTATKPCGCPDDAETYRDGGVFVAHHEDCDHSEPRRYVWQADGVLHVGTLAHYAASWKVYAYSGEPGELTTTLRTWDEEFPVTVEPLGTDDQYWTRYDLRVGDERIRVRLDGRV